MLGKRPDFLATTGALRLQDDQAAASSAALAQRLAVGGARGALSFAGQGEDWLTPLAELVTSEAWVGAWIEAAQAVLTEVAGTAEARWSGLYSEGTALNAWVAGRGVPSDAYLASAPISMTGIFLVQVARYESLRRRGLSAAFGRGAIEALTGYSQGLCAAAFIAERSDGAVVTDRLVEYLRAVTWQGFYAASVTRDRGAGGGRPMAAVVGPNRASVDAAVATVNEQAGTEVVWLALVNDWRRHVLSGRPAALDAVREALEREAVRAAAARKEGRHGGRLHTVGWEPLATSAAFHAPVLGSAHEALMARLNEIGFAVATLELPVYDPATGGALGAGGDATSALFASVMCRSGAWQQTLLRMAEEQGLDAILDLGPGTGIAHLTASAVRGMGVDVVALADDTERAGFFAAPWDGAPTPYAHYAPRLAQLADGRVVVDNAFSRATGSPPILLPGMTPTTVEVPIVAAAANAGYVAEIAGGGQVSQRIFELRMDELLESLEPGVEVVFNALLLDNYLWGMQLGKERLVQKARARGCPIGGVTISAGVPAVDEAVALLDELASLGMHTNAFKPGTRRQVEQVVAIARAAPRHTIFLHLEGGKAGGHHSWEDLDALLLESYHLVRAQPNLILCVGGGIRDEGRAAALLRGTWSEPHGLPRMPVDAVFVGTMAMACREATATPSVKRALVEAQGTDRWVYPGTAEGGVTSGKSQLNADIHYLDNQAARCGRLVDSVAGDAERVAAKRDEIIEALGRTAKPYFGDVDEMSYVVLLERMRELMATGQGGRYEDGVWPDVSYRTRFADMVRRSEARLAGMAGQEAPVESVTGPPGALDDPAGVIANLVERWPAAASARLHPADASYFVRQVCARPGKPVCFVPIIDRDVRRWYKSDSLWQAQDPRYDADQVLIIPGPEAVAGITRRDEPVAELLGRFERAFVQALSDAGEEPRAIEALRPTAPVASSPPAGVAVEPGIDRVSLTALHGEVADWLSWASSRFEGPLAELLGRDFIASGARAVPNLIRRIAAPVAGATLELGFHESERLEEVVFRLGQRLGERLVCQLIGDEVHIAIHQDDGGDGAAWEIIVGARLHGARRVFELRPGVLDEAVGRLYDAVLFEDRPVAVPLFEVARETATVSPERMRAYQHLTGRPAVSPDGLAASYGQVFSIAWPALYRTLAAAELRSDLLRLVHLSNRVDPGPVWPLAPDQAVQVEARVTEIIDRDDHRVVTTVARLHDGEGQRVAEMTSSFHIHGDFGATDHRRRTQRRLVARLELAGEAAARFLSEHDGVDLEEALRPGQTLTLEAELEARIPRRGAAEYRAKGELRSDDRAVGTISLEIATEDALEMHPLDALVETLGGDVARSHQPTPARTLAETTTFAPADMSAFAEVGGDMNPIHRSHLVARLASLDGVIVHGMWTAARLEAFLVDVVAVGHAGRLRDVQATFVAPVRPGERLELTAVRRGVHGGDLLVEATARALRGAAKVVVARVTTRLAPVRTAYVFPGQGIQQRDMGMTAYLRSPAAKAVWDRADAHTRARLGFSILRVVRENPRELVVSGERLTHPQGVLHLTQLTQVAMAVLAYAQVAELREAGVMVQDAVICGHSVGEYNALSAAAQVLPLEAVVEIVFQRGRVMHRLVPRDAEGESGYRMGVIRPHYAGLDHAGAEALVAQVAGDSGAFCEIVNYNVRGRQYSVTGQRAALDLLAERLRAEQRPGAKDPYVEVPGIDVPFHSRQLRGGVAEFRGALERYLPERIEPARLVGRYIPNLVAQPFALTPAFVTLVRDAVEGPSREALDRVLGDWERWRAEPSALARLLLVELLAWQFASPVRWIETQSQLFGELGVARMIEVGVGYQPTLANMARYTLTLERLGDRVGVRNLEADRHDVFALDVDPEPLRAERVEPPPTPVAATPPPSEIPPAPVASPGAEPVADVGLSVAEALHSLLSLQAKVRPEQIAPAETIDALFDGVSSRRNQVLIDLGAEFDLGTIDGAHEIPLSELTATITQRAGRYRAPGPYLGAVHEEALRRVFGRAKLGAKEIAAQLEEAYGFGPGLTTAVIDTLALEARDGASGRGGDLGSLGAAQPKSKDDARALLDLAVAALGRRRNTSYARVAKAVSATSVVDAQAVHALEERLLGPDSALADAARALARATSVALEPETAEDPALVAAAAERDALREELGAGFIEHLAPRFEPLRHVAFLETWAAAQRDVARLAFDGLNDRLDEDALAAEIARLRRHTAEPRVRATARWFAGRARATGRPSLATALETLATSEPPEVPFRGQTALVTGASPDSIAIAMVERLLAGGARVIVTTTSYHRQRLDFYRRSYERHAAPGAELHVVPFNQASLRDTDALIDWLFSAQTEQSGAAAKVLKPAFTPDLLVPFAALKDHGTVDQLGGRAEATLRAMVLGTERLIGSIGRRLVQLGGDGRCHVVLPLSPNHGAFGGDGAYAESKAALEVLLNKWRSEQAAWAQATTLAGARIGWVRGTGLMAANDAVAPALEAATGIRTFSNEEMADELVALCRDDARARAAAGPFVADLTGGFAAVPDLKAAVDRVRSELAHATAADDGIRALRAHERELLGHRAPAVGTIEPLPVWPGAPAAEVHGPRDDASWPAPISASPEELIVICGFGEISPGGSARTRFELEVSERLSPPAVLELAWLTGLVRFEPSDRGGTWVDVASGDPIAEHAIADRYREAVRARVGVRFTEPEVAGFDPGRVPVYQTVYLDRDLSFHVASEEEARSYAGADPESTRVTWDSAAEAWSVTRAAGSSIRVPREVRLKRQVAGQLPTGFDLARFGFAGDMLENVDPVALMNLAATVEAFVSAGTTPEELLRWVHPAKVGTTQGSGMGGMKSLHRLYCDHLLGAERQSDVLQETLINVVFAYVSASYLGSYGPMSHPVAACATAALSVEDACDKIRLGKADVVVAGGWDDLSLEGVIGFGDMNATADTDRLEAMGLEPDQMSRANDRRRKGFVEAQGGGSLLLAKGDVALKMGLPVYGVLGYAASFGDGIHRSIPAPGLGAISAALGGTRSPLAEALARHGLGADDIAVVSKHDTSTNANDPNEAGIHQAIQTALGRTPGNPLLVVSQKTLTGHSKGGAAAWQTIGLCQLLAAGVVPPNRNLEAIDGALAPHDHLLFTNERLDPGAGYPLRAGLVTSLGFGHVSALLLVIHPDAFVHALPDAERAAYLARARDRRHAAERSWAEILLGRRPLYDKRVDRRFPAADGTSAQQDEEIAMLLDPTVRLDVHARFRGGQ